MMGIVRSCELMAVRTPTVNREIARACPKRPGALPLSHLSTSPRFTTLWRVGTAIHNFARCYSQLGPLDSQLDSHLLAGETAPMAISVVRSPFPRSIVHVNEPSSTPSMTFQEERVSMLYTYVSWPLTLTFLSTSIAHRPEAAHGRILYAVVGNMSTRDVVNGEI